MTTRHPEATALADFIDGTANEVTVARVRTHLSLCAVCTVIIDGADDDPLLAGTPDLVALQQSLPPTLLGERWREALVELAVDVPASGQVWRVRVPDPFDDGPDLTDVVVVVSAGDDLLVAPVTTDQQESTDLWTVQLPIDGANMSVAAWVSLAQPVGYEALDVHLGDVDPAPVLALHRALRRGQHPPVGLATGGPVTEEMRTYRERLRSRLTLIGEARLTDLLTARAAETGEVDVVDALNSAGWSIRQVVEVTGLAPGDARAVKERRRALTDDQRGAVNAALGILTSPAAAAVPDGWVRAVATPLRRHRFEKVAAHRNVDRWKLRGEQVAEPAAARHNVGAAADWDTLAEHRLQRLEIEAGLRTD